MIIYILYILLYEPVKELKDYFNIIYINNWETERNIIVRGGKKSKLKLFSKVKQNHTLEKYLSIIKNFKIRSSVSRFRMSANNFQIEKGRHSKITIEFVSYAKKEKLVMNFTYEKLTTLRINFVKELFKINPNFILFDNQSLFEYIISMKDESIIKLSCSFIHELMEFIIILFQ